MSNVGKPRGGGITGRHEYSGEQSLSFWQRQWKQQIDSQPPKVRRETVARAQLILRTARHKSALHDLAMCYGIDGDGDERIHN